MDDQFQAFGLPEVNDGLVPFPGETTPPPSSGLFQANAADTFCLMDPDFGLHFGGQLWTPGPDDGPIVGELPLADFGMVPGPWPLEDDYFGYVGAFHQQQAYPAGFPSVLSPATTIGTPLDLRCLPPGTHEDPDRRASRAGGGDATSPSQAPRVVDVGGVTRAPLAASPHRSKSQLSHARQATQRSREKSKQHLTETTAQEQVLSAQNEKLKRCVKELKEELLGLRADILSHGNCDCPLIQQYIVRSANEISRALHER